MRPNVGGSGAAVSSFDHDEPDWVRTRHRPDRERVAVPLVAWLFYAVSLGLAVGLPVFALVGDYLGECSFDTGYESRTGVMGLAPVLVMAIGAAGVAIPVRRWRKPGLAVGLGTIIVVLGAIALVAVQYVQYQHPCD
jgi:hypothetical protein